MSLHRHESAAAASTTYLTPPDLLRALTPVECGPFDLDPCCPVGMPWRTANRMLTPADDGLTAEWSGEVWLNPPYGREADRWLARLAEHGNGLALVAARTETRSQVEQVWQRATALCFLHGRLHFHDLSGKRLPYNSGHSSVLVAYGQNSYRRLQHAAEHNRLAGSFIDLRSHSVHVTGRVPA